MENEGQGDAHLTWKKMSRSGETEFGLKDGTTPTYDYQISSLGGDIQLDGCAVHFPPGTFTETANVSISCEVDSSKWPDKHIGISPLLNIKSDKPLQKAATIELQTCFVSKGSNQVQIHIMRCPVDSEIWEPIAQPTLNSNIIKFECSEFSIFGAFIRMIDWLMGTNNFMLIGYIYVSTDENYVKVGYCFEGQKWEKPLINHFKSLGYRCKLQLNPILVSRGDVFSIKIQLNSRNSQSQQDISIEPEECGFEIDESFMRSNRHFEMEFLVSSSHPDGQKRVEMKCVIMKNGSNITKNTRRFNFNCGGSSKKVPAKRSTSGYSNKTAGTIVEGCGIVHIHSTNERINIGETKNSEDVPSTSKEE